MEDSQMIQTMYQVSQKISRDFAWNMKNSFLVTNKANMCVNGAVSVDVFLLFCTNIPTNFEREIRVSEREKWGYILLLLWLTLM